MNHSVAGNARFHADSSPNGKSRMKALVCHGPNDLRVEDLPTPTVGAHEVLIDVGAGGVCGSDLHYFSHGGFGTVRIREPMILGHEVAGTVSAVGADVSDVQVGERVAVNPSRPCGSCQYCKRAEWNQCLNMRFYGSAMPFPHIQGAFAEQLSALPAQCEPIGAKTSIHHAAMAEPLSVALHAVSRAGSLAGKHVLISGCGPIGAMCVVAARFLGALSITVTELVDAPLQVALALGTDEAINVATSDALDRFAAQGLL